MHIKLVVLVALGLSVLASCKPDSPDKVPECAEYIKALKECSNGPAGSTEEDVFRKTWNVTVAAHSLDEVKQECKTHTVETRANCTKPAAPAAPAPKKK